MTKLCKQILQFYINNFLAICMIVLPVVIPLAALKYGVALSYFSGMLFVVMSNVLAFILVPLYLGALIIYISKTVSGKNAAIKDCFQGSLKVWPRVFLVFVIVSISVSVGLALLVIPGMYLLARLSLAEIYATLDNLKPVDALILSFERTKAYQWQILGCTLIFVIPLALFVGIVPPSISSAFGSIYITSIIVDSITHIVGALVTVTFFRFYSLVNETGNAKTPNLKTQTTEDFVS